MKIEARQRRNGLRAGLLLLAVFAVLCLPVPAPAAQDCRFCHDEPLYRVDFNKSIHAGNGCTSCHVGITNIEKHRDGKEKPAPVDCGSCHQEIAKEYRNNFHYIQEDFRCSDCHRNIHAIRQDKNKNVKLAIIEKCTECHGNADYTTSGHGEAVLKGNQDAAACSDCHGLHNTRVFHTSLEQYPAEAREFYTQKCKRCHADSAMMKRNNLSDKMVAYYEGTYHGKVQELGYPAPVAGCGDCHTKHNILPKEDPRSSIHPDNLEKNCGRCHTGFHARFLSYQAHPDYTDRAKYPRSVCHLPLHVGRFSSARSPSSGSTRSSGGGRYTGSRTAWKRRGSSRHRCSRPARVFSRWSASPSSTGSCTFCWCSPSSRSC